MVRQIITGVRAKKLVPSDPKLSLNPTPACTAQSFATG
jgi:hypothetical protein